MLASIVIPAHNEARTVGRLLDALLADEHPEDFEIVVVCNGCTDDTAAVARRRSPQLTVIELAEPSKHHALVAGDQAAQTFPRVYADADVEIDGRGVRALVDALGGPEPFAVAPERDLRVDRSSRAVRSYFRVWSALPVVRDGLFGRGVIAVNAAGFARIASRPEVLGDDLYVHSRFGEHERRIVRTSRSRVHAPHRAGDLIRRRTRAAQGNAQLAATDGSGGSTNASVRSLPGIVRTQPRLALDLPAFLAITALSRLNQRRLRRSGREVGWLRDESSRS